MYLLPKMNNHVKAEFVKAHHEEFQGQELEDDISLFWKALLMTTDI